MKGIIKFLLILYCMSFVLSSCSPHREMRDMIQVNINSTSHATDTVQGRVVFVMLDDKDGKELFSSISKMVIDNKRIYILDGNSSSVYVYTLDGGLVWKIDSIGRGPGEYVRLRDFNVRGNRLYLYDDMARKLLFYDLDSRQCLSSISTPFFARAFSTLGNGDFLFVLPKDQKHKQIVISDSLCNIKAEYLSFDDDDLDNRTRYGLLQESSAGIVYCKPQCNDVHLFSKEDGRLLNTYSVSIDGEHYMKDEEGSPELCITPLLLGNRLIGNYKRGQDRYYFDLSLSQGEKCTVRHFADKKNEMTQLLYPVCAVGDSIIGSYIVYEVYKNFNHSVPVPEDLQDYLDAGGFLIGLYHLK